jgi:hypothetical protein
MQRPIDNKGGAALVAVFAVLIFLWFIIGLTIDGFRAEAVIGGAGNLGSNSNNKHNLSASASHGGIKAASSSNGGEQICIFCHTPHNAYTKGDYSNLKIDPPLWNHETSNASYTFNSTGSDWVFYNGGGGVYNTYTIPPSNVDGASRLCLGCHDGTIAIGKVRSRPSPISMTEGNRTGCLDADGSLSSSCSTNLYATSSINHHVFSVPMNDALIANADNYCPDEMKLQYPTGDVKLRPTANTYNGQPGKDGLGVQCSTCHDPHTYTNEGGTSCKFLVVGCPSPGSGTTNLCYACHQDC